MATGKYQRTKEHNQNISKAKLKHSVSDETRIKISNTLKLKGIKPPNTKGMFIGDKNPAKRPEVRAKLRIHGGRKIGSIPWNKYKCGEYHISKRRCDYIGGRKATWARTRKRRHGVGFIPLINPSKIDDKNIQWHHICPDLPFVVPCPTRIHIMFHGGDKNHASNVNAMMGFRFDICDLPGLFKHTNYEGDIQNGNI